MPRKRKKKRKIGKEFYLCDKSFLRLLTPEQRQDFASKHLMLYPPILLVENAQHGLNKPSALLDLENTINVPHWALRAKMDLLTKAPVNRYKIGAKIPIKSIYNESSNERQKMAEQAVDIVRMMGENEKKLKNELSVIHGQDTKLIELAKNHRNIPDEKIAREFNQAYRQVTQNHPQISFPDGPILPRIVDQKISAGIRKYLDDYKENSTVNSLEKAYEWTRNVLSGFDSSDLLDFLCKVIRVNDDERTKIFSRFISENQPPINRFAPFALTTTQLYLTMFLYLTENRENSSPQGVLRDFEYLYYALDDNVTFVSTDRWHEKFIEEVPLLENVRKRFRFITHKNKSKDEFKKGLRAIGIKV